ncbi:F-box/FBD/LRR-repeat protein At1g13570-like [Actinidia eriantha]|uniref:F-box/FBD/LRR-repeat protein At1g13570-like n=1 Tax=Actinidia eriantha TaxID=165200 RepID=UPI002587FB55|nr:F-box/FBD/LRR-repeat protein At1g13570-like [Actinidia eriantha]
MDQLILFVSNNGIQEFTLHIWKGELYKFPSALYSCLQLKCLNLRSGLFKPPLKIIGFKRLVSLELNEVAITAEILSNLVSGCPLLEELTLKSSTTFRFLEIAAPNLRTLCCEGLLGSICLKNAPRLAEVSVYLKIFRNKVLFNEGEIYNSTIPLGSIPAVEFMELDYYYAKVCNLLIFFPGISRFPVLELLEVQGEWSDVSLNQLRKVEMQRTSGSKPELGFIKLLVANHLC